MLRGAILELLERRPFTSFRIHLSSGEMHEVRHPEVAAMGRSLLVLIDPETDRTTTVSLLHVTSAETIQQT
jgi:hypothetical protein